MIRSSKVIDALNKILTNEMTAINQYFLHSRILKDWGFEKLGEYEYKESLEEMQHADVLIERILFLNGLPNLQDLHRLRIGENVKEILECDLKLEEAAIPELRDAITLCEAETDYVSRDLLSKILENEEEHSTISKRSLVWSNRWALRITCSLRSSLGQSPALFVGSAGDKVGTASKNPIFRRLRCASVRALLRRITGMIPAKTIVSADRALCSNNSSDANW